MKRSRPITSFTDITRNEVEVRAARRGVLLTMYDGGRNAWAHIELSERDALAFAAGIRLTVARGGNAQPVV